MGSVLTVSVRLDGIGGAPTGGLRLCPHVYNTMADVQAAIRGVQALLA